MKTKIKLRQVQFLDEALKNAVEHDQISPDQAEQVLGNYAVSEGFNAMKAWLGIGAVLVGVGLLFLVWANWAAIPNFGRVVLIVVVLSLSLGVAYVWRMTQPVTATAFWYLSAIIYGAGLFLIVESYQLQVTQSYIFFLWALGAIVLGTLKPTGWMFFMATALLALSIMVGFYDALMIRTAVVLAGLLVINKYLAPRLLFTAALIGLGLLWYYHIMQYFDVKTLYVSWGYLTIGVLLYHLPIPFNRKACQQLGLVSLGIGGFILTFPAIWAEIGAFSSGNIVSTLFVLSFIGYLLWLLGRVEPLTLGIIAALLLRYSLDERYSIALRATIFIIGGLVLLAGGFYFERKHHRGARHVH
ncbi:MAG: DUF2157 domain-containing protein [Acholeplasmatales bacterium]|nr:MAG: DUF2157 domain-containing protein [Acholeplasmatales bacterium]